MDTVERKHTRTLAVITAAVLVCSCFLILSGCSRGSSDPKKDDRPSKYEKKDAPSVGDRIWELNETKLGKYSIRNIVRVETKKSAGITICIYLNSYFWMKDGKVIYKVLRYSVDGEPSKDDVISLVYDYRDAPIDYPYDYRDRNDLLEPLPDDTDDEPDISDDEKWPYTPDDDEDYFNARDFEDPDDFWDYYSEDFESYEEAEYYWYQHH